MANHRVTSAGHTFVRVISYAGYRVRRRDQASDIYPTDRPSGWVVGDAADRVLVIGEATAMGYGVLSHQFGLASQFAHQLSIRTGRGAEWSTIPLPDNVLRNAPRLVTQVRNNIARADYVILLVGIADTVSLTSSTAWGRQLGRTLDAVLDELSADALLLLPQIPPLNKAAAIPLLGRWASTHQARLLNRVSSQSVLIRSQCISVDFPPGLDNDIGKAEASPATYRAMYAAWAAVMVDAVLPPEAAGDQSSG